MKRSTKGTKSLSAYSGASMHLVSFPTEAQSLSSLKSMDFLRKEGFALKSSILLSPHPVAVTCRRYGIARSTYYRWKKKFNPRNLQSLEDRSRRPKKIRKPQWTLELVERVQRLREEFPLLRRQSSPSSSRKRVSPFLLPRWGESSNPSKPGVF